MESKYLETKNVALVEIFTRSSPICHFCNHAKEWVRDNVPDAKVTEYNINTDSVKWAEFLRKHPSAKSVPQITMTMQNGSRRHIGGYYELIQAFSVPEQQGT